MYNTKTVNGLASMLAKGRTGEVLLTAKQAAWLWDVARRQGKIEYGKASGELLSEAGQRIGYWSSALLRGGAATLFCSTDEQIRARNEKHEREISGIR